MPKIDITKLLTYAYCLSRPITIYVTSITLLFTLFWKLPIELIHISRQASSPVGRKITLVLQGSGDWNLGNESEGLLQY